MNQGRYEELVGRVLDEDASTIEVAELEQGFRDQPERLGDFQFHLVLWELWSQECRQERRAEAFVEAWRTRLAAEAQADSFVERTVESLETKRSTRTPARERVLSLLAIARARLGWCVPIGSLALVVFLWQWWFGPTVGEPMLAEVQGAGVSIERAGQMIPPSDGMQLHAGDVLRVPANGNAAIAYAPEQTRIRLQGETELHLRSWTHGKRFTLSVGKLEVTAAHQRRFRPMVLETPQAEARVLGTEFSLLTTTNATLLQVTEGKVGFTRLSDGRGVQVSAGHYAVAASNYVLTAQPLPGKILREVWLDLPGWTFNELIHHPRYPNAPSGLDFPQNFETNTNWPSAFGTRMRAWLLPPVTGTYEFQISGNGQFCLWMSPDDDPLVKVRIGQLFGTRNAPGDLPPEQAASRQESGPIPLEAGRSYYVEAVHKYLTGEDRLTVTWKRPDGTIEPIPSTSLAPFVPKKGAKK